MNIFATLFLLFNVLHHQRNTCEANDIWNDSVRLTRGSEFLFVASIGLKNYGYRPDISVHICSGVLITKRYVLTSTHCMYKVSDLKDVRVKLGDKDLFYTTTYRVKAWTTYQLWAHHNSIEVEPLEHDISILKLTKKFGWAIRPAVITNHPNDFFDGRRVKTVVWGPKKFVPAATRLKVAELDVVSYNECIKELNDSPLMTKNHTVDKSYLCTKINLGAVLEDIDSGSPLLSNENELIAINDPTYLQRNGIHIPTNLNFHVGLDYYRTFIKNVTETGTETKCAKWWQWKRN